MFYKKEDYEIYYEKYGTGNKKIIILPGWGDTRKTFTYLLTTQASETVLFLITI